jgi:hypothetical protein
VPSGLRIRLLLSFKLLLIWVQRTCKQGWKAIGSVPLAMTQFGREEKRRWHTYMALGKRVSGNCNWKAKVMRKMPNSVIEIELKNNVPYF